MLMALVGLALTLMVSPSTQSSASAAAEEFWDAARAGDAARVTRALTQGADINAKSRYGVTALMFAADKGHLDLVRLLLDKGADPDVQDGFYQMRAINLALQNGHVAVAKLLVERGARGAGALLLAGVRTSDRALIETALASKDLTRQNLASAAAVAKKIGNAEIVELLDKRAASLPAEDVAATVTIDPAVLQSYVGVYRDESTEFTLTFTLNGKNLQVSPGGQPARPLVALATDSFRVEDSPLTLTFSGRAGTIERVIATQNNSTQTFQRLAAPVPAAATPAATNSAGGAAPADIPPTARTTGRPWPAFRGANAAGNGDGQGAVTQWNVADGTNIKWKTAIPGIANASPIVWGNQVFVVTAISSAGDATFRTGLYGDVAPVNDMSEHTWKLYSLDRASGKILWERTAFTGLPKVKLHTKASQANSTPATDGSHVVALFGSIGLLTAWDMSGKPLWKVDVGVLDSGWFFDPTYQWGHSSSPIIHDGRVIVQADRQKSSYLAAYEIRTGKLLWRTERPDEISSWGTPTIFHADGRDQIVTNGTKVRGYDPSTGRQIWSLSPNSEVAVATPIVGNGLVYISGGYPPIRPIYAIKPTAAGEIVLPKDQLTHSAIAWSNTSGTYIPSPVYYSGILYTCSNEGILTAYDGQSGERLYRARVDGGGSFSASPIAADGKLYFSNEDGDVIVVRAGRTYQELAKNSMKEVIMSTPAISDGLILIRTLGHMYGIGR